MKSVSSVHGRSVLSAAVLRTVKFFLIMARVAGYPVLQDVVALVVARFFTVLQAGRRDFLSLVGCLGDVREVGLLRLVVNVLSSSVCMVRVALWLSCCLTCCT